MSGMITTTLGSVGKVRMCKRIMKDQTSSIGDIPFYKIGTFGGRPDCYISRDLYEDYKSRFSYPKVGNILISASGTIGRTVRYNGEEAYYQDSNIVWIDNDESQILDDYLYYIYPTLKWVTTKGATIARLYNDNIEGMQITFPKNLDLQRKVADVLANIDRKITINKSICASLESMAKTLYDYWFVQFDFPDANGRPYKTSGGKMVWNEELGREIPEGWQILSLKELASYSTERISSSEMTRQNYVGMDNMIANRCGIKESEYDPPEGDMIRFKANYILLGNIRPYFKKIWLAGYNGGCSPDVLAIMPNEDSISEFVYTTLSQDTFFDYDTAGAKGTKMPRGDKDHIMSYPISWNKKLAIIFGERLRAGYKMRNKLMIENKSLTKLRDFLLPMLMNGQVGFKET